MKVLTLVGTRPELIKLSLTIAELDRRFEHVLVHSGQNYDFELNEIFFRDLSIRKPNYFLEASGATAAQTIGKIIEKFDEVLAKEQPHAVLVLGDTNSCLGVIAAKRRRIPTFHMEAGNRCFDDRVPEEINRRIVDHTSDINMAYSEHARRHLLVEGIRPDTVFVTGSPMKEILLHYADRIRDSNAMTRMGLKADAYFLASAHREENVDDPRRLQMLLEALSRLTKEFDLPILFSTHPRTRERIGALGSIPSQDRITFSKPMGFHDYVALQQAAFCVVSDSGTLTEESAILGFPAVMIRDAHERPEGVDEGIVPMSGIEPDRVIEAVRLVRGQRGTPFKMPRDYEADNVSAKVARIILSYTDFVNHTTWRKGS